MLKVSSLFSPVTPGDDEFVEVLMQGASRIERIVSSGHVSPPGFWYDQDESEFVAVVEGNAELEFEHERVTMNAGDWLIIPAHERHRVSYTSSPCVWLCVFSPA